MEQMWINLPAAAKFAVPFLLVLVVVGLAAFLWLRFGTASVTRTPQRGQRPRLAVVDAVVVDARRRLVLIRRDNAEHLLMIGGPTDIVIEPNIVQSESAPRQAAPTAPSEPPIRRTDPLETATPARSEPEERAELRSTQIPSPTAESIAAPRQERLHRPGPLSSRVLGQERHEESRHEPVLPPLPPRTGPARERATAGSAANLIPSEPDGPAAAPSAPVLREPMFEAPASGLQPAHATVPQAATPPRVPAHQEHDNDANLAELAERLEAALRRSKRLADQQAIPSPTPIAPSRPAHTAGTVPPPEPHSTAAPDTLTPDHDEMPGAFEAIETEMARMIERPRGDSPKP